MRKTTRHVHVFVVRRMMCRWSPHRGTRLSTPVCSPAIPEATALAKRSAAAGGKTLRFGAERECKPVSPHEHDSLGTHVRGAEGRLASWTDRGRERRASATSRRARKKSSFDKKPRLSASDKRHTCPCPRRVRWPPPVPWSKSTCCGEHKRGRGRREGGRGDVPR